MPEKAKGFNRATQRHRENTEKTAERRKQASPRTAVRGPGVQEQHVCATALGRKRPCLHGPPAGRRPWAFLLFLFCLLGVFSVSLWLVPPLPPRTDVNRLRRAV